MKQTEFSDLGQAPSHKLGVKFLDDVQMRNTLPNYGALLRRIGEQRNIANYGRNAGTQSGQHSQMYDNVYCILGGRGTGKSSVIFTLQEKLRKDGMQGGGLPQDILFPIITPEVINDKNCSILGWIMAMAETVVERIEHEVRRNAENLADSFQSEHFERACGETFFKNCQYSEQNSLRRHYNELFQDSTRMGEHLSTTSFEDAAVLKTFYSQKQYRLTKSLNEFWDRISRTWFALREHQCRQKRGDVQSLKYPLIIFMFDDIDLVPERSMELLHTTFQYFSGSNVVLVLTAAEKVLKQVIRLKMLERMVGSQYHSLLQDFFPNRQGLSRIPQSKEQDTFRIDTAEKMAKEFYDKVIPPSSRYHLIRYRNIEERLQYHYAVTLQSFSVPEEKAALPINKLLTQQVDRLIEQLYGSSGLSKGSPVPNFLWKQNKEEDFRKSYLVMFGDKNRNIANSCLEIIHTVESLGDLCNAEDGKKIGLTEENRVEVMYTLRHLLKTLVLSNQETACYENEVEDLLYNYSGDHFIFVNYARVIEIYCDEKQEVTEEVEKQLRYSWNLSGNDQPDSYYLSSERKTSIQRGLKKIKRRMGILITCLFFVENFLLILDPKRKRIHGYRELFYLINADVENTDISKIPSEQPDFRFFPLYDQVNQYLDSMPTLLEHLDRYVMFDRYDQKRIAEYLQDLFFDGGSDPKRRLQEKADTDRKWVKTVLSMLYMQYSGLALISSGAFRFLSGEQKLLSFFSFTADLYESIDDTMQYFLSQSQLGIYSGGRMKEFANLICQPMDVALLGERIQRWAIAGLSYLEQYERYLQLDGGDHEGFLHQYLIYRWNIYIRHTNRMPEEKVADTADLMKDMKPGALPYLVQRFVRELLHNCIITLRLESYINLDADDISEMRNLLQKIPVFDQDLWKALQALKEELLWFTEDEDASEASTEEASSKVCFPIASESLIDYLLEARRVFHESNLDGLMNLRTADTHQQEIFQLMNYLVLYPEEEEIDLEYGAGIKIPFSAYLICDLKLIEFLLPYYFSACMQVELANHYHSEMPLKQNGSSSKKSPLSHFDDQMRNFFIALTEPKRVAPETRRLYEIMDEAKEDLIDWFCRNNLEDEDE